MVITMTFLSSCVSILVVKATRNGIIWTVPDLLRVRAYHHPIYTDIRLEAIWVANTAVRSIMEETEREIQSSGHKQKVINMQA